MRKWIRNGLIVSLIVIFMVMIYPVMFNKYGENLIIIRKLLNILVVMECICDIYRSINKFGYGIYRYYKLLGLKEIGIFNIYVKNNDDRFLAYFCSFLISVFDGNVLIALVNSLQYIVYCICMSLIFYFLLHKAQYKIVFFRVCRIVSAIICVYILHKLFVWINNDVAFIDILHNIFSCMLMDIYNDVFFVSSIYHGIVLAVLLVFLVITLYNMDDKMIIEEHSVGTISGVGAWNDSLKRIGGYRILRDMLIAFRDKGNLFSYVLTFGLYIFGCFIFGNNSKILVGISCFTVILINYGLESIYINDLLSFKLYKLFGERFDDFFRKKITIAMVINMFFGIVYTIKCMVLLCFKELIVLLIFHATIVLYWNLYYSSIYINMRRYGTLVDDIKKIIILFIGIVPVVNMLFGVWFYKKGKRVWNYYVNNGQCDKNI